MLFLTPYRVVQLLRGNFQIVTCDIYVYQCNTIDEPQIITSVTLVVSSVYTLVLKTLFPAMDSPFKQSVLGYFLRKALNVSHL